MKGIRYILALSAIMALSFATTSCSSNNPLKRGTHAKGQCPSCGEDVFGGIVAWNGVDEAGKPVGGKSFRAECSKCSSEMSAEAYAAPTGVKVNWKMLPASK